MIVIHTTLHGTKNWCGEYGELIENLEVSVVKVTYVIQNLIIIQITTTDRCNRLLITTQQLQLITWHWLVSLILVTVKHRYCYCCCRL